MGPIGSGKTVQAQAVAKQLGWQTFSTGQLVREDANPEAAAASKAGRLAPTEYVQELVLAKIKSIDGDTGIILDGSPRMPAEIKRLDAELPQIGRHLDLAIFLNISQQEVERRLAARGRHDDHPEIIPVRWAEYERDTLPVVETLRSDGRVCDVDAQASEAVVTAAIIRCLQERELV